MIQILKYLSAETGQSPEGLDLLSGNGEQARRVFGDVETTVWRPGMDEPNLGRGDYVLLLGASNVLIGAASLTRMKAGVDGGASIAVPTRITAFPRPDPAPLYSLRAYERLERQLLENGAGPPAPPSSQLPVSLLARSAVDRVARQRRLSELLTDPVLLGAAAGPAPVAAAGVFHEFTDYYGEARADLLPYLPKDAADVLEVGCGRGKTGALIQETIGCRVTGVEMNAEVAAEAAGRLFRVIVGDIRTTPIEGRFDAVVASELFEHLDYPREFLTLARTLLKPGGRIVLSVPNVGHYSVVEQLLAGRWDYLPSGLLCYTHFRFFTKATLEDWIGRAGFTRWDIVAQATELPDRFLPLTGLLDVELDSLRTKGFYVVLYDART